MGILFFLTERFSSRGNFIQGHSVGWAWFSNLSSICIAKHLGMHGMEGGTQVCSYVAVAEMAPGSLQGG